jgi:hypothetical protein
LFALTWRPLNPSPKHDFGQDGFQSCAVLKKCPVPLEGKIKSAGAGLTPPAGDCRAVLRHAVE